MTNLYNTEKYRDMNQISLNLILMPSLQWKEGMYVIIWKEGMYVIIW